MANENNQLQTALVKFKQEQIRIRKESDNPFFKSKYADLPTILEAVEKPLAELGLFITSTLEQQEGGWIVKTSIAHKDSAEMIVSTFPVFGNKPQEIGSSVTYARRYNIQSLLNLAAEDDDGNAANNAPKILSFKTAKERTELFNEVKGVLESCTNLEDLQFVWKSRSADLNKLRNSDEQIYFELEKIKNNKKEKLGGGNA